MIDLKKLVQSNAVFASIGYKAKQAEYAFFMKANKRLRVDPSKIVFFRSGGIYGDNPKAIAEYMHNTYPAVKLVWAYSNPQALKDIPEYIVPVKRESYAFFKELATAGAWVCSNPLPKGTVKKANQIYIQTWHGDKFLKKIANDATDIESYRKKTSSREFCEDEICDYFVTGCEWFVPIAASALGYHGAFLRCGMPRNDCLVNLNAEKCEEIKRVIGLDPDVNVLIYAPTFRDYERTCDSVGSNIDLVRILDLLEEKYGRRWICLLRAHNGKNLKINHKMIEDPRFKDVTAYPDMADLLMISDMLISDYSSCGADFSIRGKMVLLYQDDIEQYTTEGRTLYFSPEESPYFTAFNMEEALAIIKRVTEEDIRKNCQEILDFYDSFESGHACETVCSTIMNAFDGSDKCSKQRNVQDG